MNKIKLFITELKRINKQVKNTRIEYDIVYRNDNVNVVHDAAITCYGTKPKTDYSEKGDYIGRLIKSKHESVIEHSNLISIIIVPISEAQAINNVLVNCKYLITKINTIDDGNNICLVISGSLRGYKHIFRETWDINNSILQYIKQILYKYTDKCFFEDFITDNIFEEDKFADDESVTFYEESKLVSKNMDLIGFRNTDDFLNVYNKLSPYGFSFNDILELCTITIRFDHMSRIITQQATRHRNAITQMSQRYVNFSVSSFNDPGSFKKAKYLDKYKVTLNNTEVELSLQELGEELCKVYGQLNVQGVEKEDCRGFLPQNVDSGTFYMTYTFKNLLKFLELRTDTHAQAEIKVYADIIAETFLPYLANVYLTIFDSEIVEYTDIIKPIYKNPDAMYNIGTQIKNIIDEPLDGTIKEEVVDAFENDISYDNKDYL